MNAQEMWLNFTATHPEAAGAAWEAWAYGDAPDELAALTLSGKKRATASALPLYALEGETPPQPGEYSVLLNSRGDTVCVLKTTRVEIIPYGEVPADFAAKEGEGDLSLRYWRQVHRAYFTRVMAKAGLAFTEDMPVVCEEFEVVHP